MSDSMAILVRTPRREGGSRTADVLPPLPLSDDTDGSLMNPISGGKDARRDAPSSSLAQFDHANFGHFVSWDRLPKTRYAVGYSVRLVRKASIPSQVRQMVVEVVAVVMAAFHSLWARANKRQQDQAVNWHLVVLAAPAQMGVQPPSKMGPQLDRMWGLLKHAEVTVARIAAQVRPHVAAIANFIAGKAGDWSPFFGGGDRIVLHAEPPIQCATPPAVTSSAGALCCPDYSTSVRYINTMKCWGKVYA